MRRSRWWCVLLLAGVLVGQEKRVTVPFVGCPSDGQVGYLPALKGAPVVVPIRGEDAARLAFYKAEFAPGVLAPRGWSCFGVYGSGGATLWVGPQKIPQARWFNPVETDYVGPMVEMRILDKSWEIANAAAPVFPKHLEWAKNLWRGTFDNPEVLRTQPNPVDKLRYRNSRTVEFTTPAGQPGLGTERRLKPGPVAIEGVAMLVGERQEQWKYWQVSVRLPLEYWSLRKVIVEEVVRVGKAQVDY